MESSRSNICDAFFWLKRQKRFRISVRSWSFWIISLFIFLALNLQSAYSQVTAVLDPDTIREGEMTELRISVDAIMGTSQPVIPKIDGLEIVSVNHSTTMQFINGRMLGTVNYSFGILGQKAGNYTIPPIQVESGKNGRKTNAVQLHVLKSPDTFVQPQTSPNPVPTPQNQNPATPGNDTVDSAPSNSKQIAWIELNYPKREFYVGELIPVDLKVYIPKTIKLSKNYPPSFTSTSFTYSKLGDAQERATIVNGIPYRVYTWHPTISAVKAGEHPLNAQMDLNVLVTRQTRPQSLFGGGAFNDPFFDSFFNEVVEQKVTITSPTENVVKVLPLPNEGKPADYSGAIGKFEMTTTAEPTEVNAGDPVTIKTTISGTGNFDRVHTPDLPKSNDYKTYPPNSKFEGTDEVGYSGQKVFEQVLIPKSSELKAAPEIKFHYFDPEAHKYVTLTGNPIRLKVTGVAAPEPSATARVPSSNSSPSSQTKIGATELVANKLEMGTPRNSLQPVIGTFWFWGTAGIPVTGLIIAWITASRKRRLASDPRYARSLNASKAIRTHLQSMDGALKRGDSNAFFVAGRRAIRERLGELLLKNPDAITLGEVEQSLELSPQLHEGLRRFFDMADAVEYSGETYTPEALAEWKQAVIAILQQLEKRRKP